MPIKRFKPDTPARRGMSVLTRDEITENKPEKSLLRPIKKKAGRNNTGQIVVRHRGGGAKRRYRVIDFKRDKIDVVGVVDSIQYDPNRTSNIALIKYVDGEKRYIIHPKGLKVGDEIISSDKADIKIGNTLPLMNIPIGTFVHNIELKPGKGAQMARSAGSSVQILGREDKYALLRLASGEVRKVLGVCKATIGEVGNEDHSLVSLGSAGRKRHLGFRPTVRGSVMNPNDHPHGGGEGKAPIGRKTPVTPWGKPTLGYKTRNKKKKSNDYIVRRRDVK